MGKKSNSPYAGIEVGLSEANKTIRGNKKKIHSTGIVVTQIARKIVSAMKNQSPNVYGKLFHNIFVGGSSYEGLKIGEKGDFDIDILLKIPEVTCLKLHDDTIPASASLQLVNFHKLQYTQPALFQAMKKFVDRRNYLLTSQLKSTFMQSIFDKTRENYFPGGIKIGTKNYKITRVRIAGPAFTLTIERTNFFVQIDLVPCIVLSKHMWPEAGFRQNPYRTPSEFFIVPKKPKRGHTHVDRYFRLSFQQQERKRIFHQYWMKPTIRIIKRIRDHFDHQFGHHSDKKLSSYAIKTLFMWEQEKLDPDFWKGSFSFCLVHMLERLSECLKKQAIWYFWNTTNKLNLLDNLSREQIACYRNGVNEVVKAIKANPTPEVIRRYLST